MPVIINFKICDNCDACNAIPLCPTKAYRYNNEKNTSKKEGATKT